MSFRSFIYPQITASNVLPPVCARFFLCWHPISFLINVQGQAQMTLTSVRAPHESFTVLCAPAMDPAPRWDHHIVLSLEVLYLFFPMYCELL